MSDSDDVDFENSVFLRGLLGDEVKTRSLPSGDDLCSFRLTVRRPPESTPGRTKVDSIDCASTSARVRKAVLRARPGDVLEVNGRLQRRFWRSPGGVASRYEVEVRSLTRLTPATRRRQAKAQASD
jgi:single-strand DNA-binding protein